MNDVEQLDDDNLPAEELFMSGLFRPVYRFRMANGAMF